MKEKKNRMLQILDLAEGENVTKLAEEHEKKLYENIARRREELRQWLESRGLIPKGEKK